MTKEISGTLEVDATRGVIYFHPHNPKYEGRTLLRICNLPDLSRFGQELLDITHMVGPPPRIDYSK